MLKGLEHPESMVLQFWLRLRRGPHNIQPADFFHYEKFQRSMLIANFRHRNRTLIPTLHQWPAFSCRYEGTPKISVAYDRAQHLNRINSQDSAELPTFWAAHKNAVLCRRKLILHFCQIHKCALFHAIESKKESRTNFLNQNRLAKECPVDCDATFLMVG